MGKFARTEADEKRFAAGYPFLFTLADGEASESAAIAMKIRDALDPITTTTWNREVATHYVLGLAGGKPGAIDARRAATILAKLCATTQISYGWHGTNAVLILEQLVGTPPVIEAVLRFFETTPVKRWDVGATVNEIAYALGFLLLRTPATKRKAYVRRMQTLVAKGRPSESFAAEFLDFASGGTAAVERSLDRKLGTYYLHFIDDLALLREVVAGEAKDPWMLDARHAYLAGDMVLEALAKGLHRVPKWRKAQLYAELAPIASKKAAAIVAELADKHGPKALKRPRRSRGSVDRDPASSPSCRSRSRES